MKWYPWLRPHFEQLIGSYQVGRGHHALLIQALPGMGDDALIYAITRFLMCQQPEGHKSCGKCRGCQLMQAGTHPDYYTLEPEKGKNTLGIDAVREVSEKLYEYARLGGESGVAERRRATHGSRSQRPVKNPGRAAREYLVFPLLPRAGTLAGDAAQSLPSSPPRCPSGILGARLAGEK